MSQARSQERNPEMNSEIILPISFLALSEIHKHSMD